ncbi:NrfA- nitrite reduction protein [Mangrovimicrobium sediminis]|uniref:nitrite reductase (cytochrome; ammonia-forming) n=1 Tax=Mangrovimicrobium sediminis TaxID=2562682 RepID=A0A4Z0LX83_9GAMM|nr:cytochrome c3 family protein [Haliea sp. SAOS-164]TGD71766.1 NrfA- nitrite reduction protein [Haliea sp. SAOS-164]
MASSNTPLWILWLLLTVLLGGWLLSTLFGTEEEAKTVFLPGTTTPGHHQIETVCSACHGESFSDRDAMQERCEGCHADALKAAKDDHPKSKFTDPRNADRIEVLDARYCVTCHVEHRPELTAPMGVTIPADTCYLCHQDIAGDRPSHEGMGFDTCTSAGCHNFHDNTALYEDFLLRHADSPATDFAARTLQANLAEIAEMLPDYPLADWPIQPVALADQALPEGVEIDAHIAEDWLASGHARSGVGCNACHVVAANEDAQPAWTDHPDETACAGCHAGEVQGFYAGRHGMRLDSAKLGRRLAPMTPGEARLPMRAEAADHELDCQSCHGAHRYDIREAAVQSCLGCHADEHSLAYEESAHHRLWQAELAGSGEPGSGVSCASCHMPRVDKDYFWGTFVHNEVQHNQSANLAPNEKMLRPVCLQCHGLGFAIDALADPDRIRDNFSQAPTVHIESIDLALRRAAADDAPEDQ